MLQMSRKGQMSVDNLSGFTIALLVVGIVVVIAFLIRGSFQTTLTRNGEATTAVNISISNVNNALNTIVAIPITILVTIAVVIIEIIVVVLSFVFGGRREEGSD